MKRNLILSTMFTALCLLSNTVNAQCTFTPTVTPNNLILCPNETDTLWTQVWDSYQWYKGGAPVPGATNQYYVVDAFNDGGYYFKVAATQAGCMELSDSVLVDGWAFLPPFVISYGDMSLCPGEADSVIFELGQPYTSNIQWFNGGSPIAGAHDDTLIVYGPGVYTVQGSPAVCPNYVATIGVPLVVNYYATPVITPASIELCAGMSDTIYSQDLSTSYQWYMNGVLTQNSAQDFLVVNSAGDYHLTLAKDDSTCILSSDTVEVQVYQPGSVSIIFASGALMAASTPNPVSGYQWYLNGNAIPGATNPSYLPTQSGSYTVTALDSFCSIASAPYNYTVTDVDDIDRAGISVSPNPFSHEIKLNAQMPFTAAIYSVDGRKLIEEKNKASIQTSHLLPGLYIITIANNEGGVVKTAKLLKQ